MTTTDPRFTELDAIYKALDAAYAKAIANSGMKPACGFRCPGCCIEPVYASRIEAERLLASLSPEQIEELKPKVTAWLKRFYDSGLQNVEEVNAYQYRELNLKCPLLVDGLCSVYAHRPSSCRMHWALKHRSYCEDNVLRHQQKFAINTTLARQCGEYIFNIENHLLNDHLGVLLGELLIGPQPETAARAELVPE